MKEIIYLDTDIMNSMLAQLDQGLIDSFSLEQSSQESESSGQQSARGKNAGLNGSIVAGSDLFGGKLQLGASLGNNGIEGTNETHTMLEGQKDVLNKAFHDYALEILIRKLQEKDLLVDKGQVKQGSFCLSENKYKFYDFKLINKLVDIEKIPKMMFGEFDKDKLEEAKKLTRKPTPKESEKDKYEKALQLIQDYESYQPTIETFKQFELFSSYFSNSLGDTSLVKARNLLCILKNQYLREYPESLSLRPDKSRKAKLLVRIIGKKLKSSSMNIIGSNISVADFDTLPNLIFDGLLESFEIYKVGDFMATPIAIYYE